MAKKKGNGLFQEASKLRAKHPHKYKEWTDYVKWASRLQKGEGKSSRTKKKSPAKKRSVGTTYKPVKGIVHAKAVGSLSYHKKQASYHNDQARKKLLEELGWLMVCRDQERLKTERTKLSKKIALKRQELHKLK